MKTLKPAWLYTHTHTHTHTSVLLNNKKEFVKTLISHGTKAGALGIIYNRIRDG